MHRNHLPVEVSYVNKVCGSTIIGIRASIRVESGQDQMRESHCVSLVDFDRLIVTLVDHCKTAIMTPCHNEVCGVTRMALGALALMRIESDHCRLGVSNLVIAPNPNPYYMQCRASIPFLFL